MKNHLKRHHKKYASSLIGLAVTIGMSWGASYAIPNTLLPNTHIGQVSVGGYAYADAQQKLTDAVRAYKEGKVTLSVIGKNYSFGLDELGVQFDIAASTEQADVVEEASFLERVQQIWQAISNPTQYKVVVDVDREKMKQAIVAKVPELDDPEVAQARFFNNALSAELDAKIGLPADYKKVEKDLIENVQNFRNAPIEVKVLARESAEEGGIEVHMADFEREALEASEAELRAVTLELLAELSNETKSFKVPLAEREDWLRRRLSLNGWYVTLDSDAVRSYVEQVVLPEVERAPEDAYIKALPAEGEKRADVEGIVRWGVEVDVEALIDAMVAAVENRDFASIQIPSVELPAYVFNDTGVDLGDLELLASGRSNFAGSPEGRDFNIRKALDEHYNNVLLAPGEKFSYNALLGGPVTYSRGWKASLAIFGGGSALRPVPGGGLCQVSTTIYRAAVNAGLKVTARRAHSLYVHYYVPYGEGLDSTIFPGSQDLVFENDTDNYILMQTYAIGDDAFVNFYGTDDGRSVELDGPYRYNEVPEGVIDEEYGRPFRRDDIVWFQKITRPDGTVEENQLVSRYKKPIPRKQN